MNIKLITFASSLMKPSAIRDSHQEMLTALEQHFNIQIIDYHNIDTLSSDYFCMAFIASGGTERLYQQCFEQMPRPYVLLADGQANSLAASLEISSWITSRGQKCEILHGDYADIVSRINELSCSFQAMHRLQGKRIGVVGTPSSWLIASDVDYLLTHHRWGVDYVDIPLEQLIDYYKQITDDEVTNDANCLITQALSKREGSLRDMIKSLRIYQALKRIIKEQHLDALTLSCFKMLETISATGCLALALLNDEGIPAGCEGDLQAIFTMLVAQAITGQGSFMANPSIIHTKENELLISHCTIGLKQTRGYVLRSHFESGIGIGIQGIMPLGDVTIVKCGGKCLDQFYLSTGLLVENTNHPHMCRTQIRIQMNTPVDYFLRNPLGNHHIIIEGNHQQVLEGFFSMNGCSRVE